MVRRVVNPTDLSIAQTILSQIESMTEGPERFLPVVSKGDYVALPETSEYQGGVQFSLRRRKRLSKVVIQLTYTDVYIIQFWQWTDQHGISTGKMIKEWDEVYADQLAGIVFDIWEMSAKQG